MATATIFLDPRMIIVEKNGIIVALFLRTLIEEPKRLRHL